MADDEAKATAGYLGRLTSYNNYIMIVANKMLHLDRSMRKGVTIGPEIRLNGSNIHSIIYHLQIELQKQYER